MSWIDAFLNILFPPPVSLKAFNILLPGTAHTYESWILSATQYKGDSKKIAKYIKETPDKHYIYHCAKKMAHCLESELLENSIFISDNNTIHLVPVPQHKTTTKARGFSQSELLATEITKLLPYTKVSQMLVKIKKTEKQALLPKHKRLTNQIGSFSYNNKDHDTNNLIVLVDDISTTGSTLRECRKVLMNQGFKNIIAVVFAH